MNPRLLVLAAALAAAAWAFRRWRQGVKAAMVLLIVEGGLRKWVFPGAQDLIYFAKDLLLVGVYLGFLGRGTGRAPLAVPGGLQAALVAGVALGAFQIFNPDLPNLLVGVLGFKAYFLYLPLLWVVPRAFESDRELARFLRRYVLLAIPVGLLAVAQFLSPASSPLNTYARSASQAPYVATFGTSTQVRVTGTFSFITGFTSYLLAIAILTLALLAATRWRYRGNLALLATLALTLLGMLMTGSRGPVFMLALLLPLYWWLGLAREAGGASMMGRFLLGVSLLAVLLNYVGSDAVEAFYGRASSATDVRSRIVSPFLQPFLTAADSGLTGFGIGATHQTAEAVTKGMIPYSWLKGRLVEDEPGRVMLELGLPGFVLIYVARLTLIFLALSQVFVLRTAFHRAIATSCVLFFLAHLPGGVVFNVTSGVYYWFFSGLLFLAMRLDAVRRESEPVPAAGPAAEAAAGRPRPRGLVPSEGPPRPQADPAPRWEWPLPPP
jgi:hypothetical protein